MASHAKKAWLRGPGHELFYTTMQTARWAKAIYCAISLTVSGCGGSDTGGAPNAGGAANAGGASNAGGGLDSGGASSAGVVSDAGATSEHSLTVIQVETVTTVQSSAGSFLSPTPEQLVPAYVERNTEDTAASAGQQERAKIDIALLFRGTQAGTFNQQLDAQLVSENRASWSAIEHCFPHVEQSAADISWPLNLSNVASELDNTVSPEWRGWQDFRGLGVRGGAGASELSAPVATLDFQASGLSSPLLLSSQGSSLLVTNRSSYAIPRALLIYSHPGGVGVTALEALDPGEQRVTVLGPKEHPADALLELARGQLTDFFAASVGPELAPAMAAAKSIPFLETQGLRLIALLSDESEPAAVSFSAPVATHQRVLVSHSEILKPEEEARVLGLVMDPSIGVDNALETFGRFTQAKLEFAEQSSDPSVSAKASVLLTELRSR